MKKTDDKIKEGGKKREKDSKEQLERWKVEGERGRKKKNHEEISKKQCNM